MTTEGAWVEAARQGDRHAFGKLVELYQKPVYSLAYRLLGNVGDAEDAAQEAFVKAYRAIGSYDAGRSFSTWLLSITAHFCIDRLRRRRLQEVSLEGLPPWREPQADLQDPYRALEEKDREEQIQRLLQCLSEDYRAVVVLRYWHDLGYAEIAEVMGETESAIKSRLHRARRQLAEMMHAPDTGPAGPPSIRVAAVQNQVGEPAWTAEHASVHGERGSLVAPGASGSLVAPGANGSLVGPGIDGSMIAPGAHEGALAHGAPGQRPAAPRRQGIWELESALLPFNDHSLLDSGRSIFPVQETVGGIGLWTALKPAA